MRRMTRALTPEWETADEQGAILIIVVLLTVTLIAISAMVVDVGAILDERRQLQNGADAGALAVAQSCAIGPCDVALAASMADLNSRDGDSAVDSVTYPAANQVRVTTSTRSGGGSILPYAFGQILTGVEGRTIRATATAAWVQPVPANATAVPIGFSKCQVDQLVPGAASTIYVTKPTGPCALEEGMGWLDGDCPSVFTAGLDASGDPGKSGPKDCLGPLKDSDVRFPVFDTITGTGTNTNYHIVGFAVLRLTGWRYPSDESSPRPCGSPATCVAGTFVSYITPGPGTGPGQSGVSLVS